jgi:hypothetical protein
LNTASIADIEAIVEKAVSAATSVIREEFCKLFSEIQTRLQTTEERLNIIEQKLEQTELKQNVTADLEASLRAVRTEAREFTLAANDSEQYQRRNNLRIKGLSVQKDDDCRNVVAEFVRGMMKLSMNEEDIEAAHILPGRVNASEVSSLVMASSSAARGTTPMVIVRFRNREVRDKIIRHQRALKNSNKAVVEDLTALNMKTINRLRLHHDVQKTWTWNGRIFAVLTDNCKVCVRPFQTIAEWSAV